MGRFGVCAALLLLGGFALRVRSIKVAAMGWLTGVTATLLTAAIAFILARTAAP
jgi:hypothetical protein